MYVTLYKAGEDPTQVPLVDAEGWIQGFGWSREPVAAKQPEPEEPKLLKTTTTAKKSD